MKNILLKRSVDHILNHINDNLSGNKVVDNNFIVSLRDTYFLGNYGDMLDYLKIEGYFDYEFYGDDALIKLSSKANDYLNLEEKINQSSFVDVKVTANFLKTIMNGGYTTDLAYIEFVKQLSDEGLVEVEEHKKGDSFIRVLVVSILGEKYLELATERATSLKLTI